MRIAVGVAKRRIERKTIRPLRLLQARVGPNRATEGSHLELEAPGDPPSRHEPVLAPTIHRSQLGGVLPVAWGPGVFVARCAGPLLAVPSQGKLTPKPLSLPDHLAHLDAKERGRRIRHIAQHSVRRLCGASSFFVVRTARRVRDEVFTVNRARPIPAREPAKPLTIATPPFSIIASVSCSCPGLILTMPITAYIRVPSSRTHRIQRKD